MKLKRIDAVAGLLSVIALLVHIGYTAYAYLAFYYNPTLKLLTAVPFMVLACLHAVLGMSAVFLQGTGPGWISIRSRISGRSSSGSPRR